ncbi:hypothetical protein KI688_003925 [Linnemannia hyalina]|uniref:Atos-like conserved domain-containing protein n=1 Tax=Linnemannia hyalina TaxID=64524 RepID=A0A9P7XNN2_9FUNG|nr:hypothetical protein KI688_003925 [Linnemannia hyalina]
MPTPNAFYSALQPSVAFSGTVPSTVVDTPTKDQDLLPHHQFQQAYPTVQSSNSHLHSHGPSSHSHAHSRSHSQAHSGCQHGPDPAVMEFLSKIGQIIIKARTPTPAVPGYPSSSNSAVVAEMTTTSGNCNVPTAQPQQLQQPSLESVLQDMDLWRNSTPVHVNILHSAQHILLERWVISFIPTAASSPNAMSADLASITSPYTGYLSPKAKHQQTAQCACPPSSAAPAQLKDTTDLVLLVQSLYTQIRSLPLQNCLTSFDEKTKLAKNDLAYSVTSAREDITQSRQDKTLYSCTQPIVGEQDTTRDAPVVDLSEEPYTEFATSLRTTLPLEFVQAASLKLINFEASHMQWGCIRVTGMYDESVGGRIAPEDFQDLTKVQKKRHSSSSKTKISSASSAAIAAAKLAKRQQKEESTWTSAAQPVKADLAQEPARSPISEPTVLNLNGLPTKSPASIPDANLAGSTHPPPVIDRRTQQSSSPVLSPEDQFRARLQALKQNGNRLFSSISSSMGRSSPAAQDPAQETPRANVLQESLLPKNDERSGSTTPTQEGMQAYRFPPPSPSPPLSIPVPRRDSVSDRKGPSPLSPEAQLEKTPTGTEPVAPQYGQYPAAFQPSPPYTQQHYHPSRHAISTSPLAHVITRRRSSRLSIVMNCDDSPDPGRTQSPEATQLNRKFFNDSDDDDDDNQDSSSRPSSNLTRRWGSLQDQRHSFTLDSRAQSANSPSRHSYLRRSSLNPLTGSHGDLFGSLVGSYEESILSGRMSTLPSKPLIFTAQIGVLANQDYKDCPPKLRCPKHVQLEFPAVFYDYESSSNKHQHGSHSTHHQHQHHHHHQSHHPYYHQNTHPQHSHPTFSTQPGPSSFSHSFKSNLSFSQHVSTSPSHHPMGSYASSPNLSLFLSSSAQLSGSHGSAPNTLSHSLTRAVPTAQDDPILPYVGNLDLDSSFRGARRFARMPGGMRIPLRGQVQVMIKNPNKTVVKVFLVPYDFTDMPSGTKTFLRQKYYSTGAGMGPVSSTVSSSGTLRYAIHLQFCCPAPGYVYLYRSIRVVFANRVPDGKESLRVVLEGLGIGSTTLVENGVSQTPAAAEGHAADPRQAPARNFEERYVRMRKGEVPFSGSKRKKDQDVCMDDLTLGQPLRASPVTAFGLGLNGDFTRSAHSHNSFNPYHSQQQRLDFDGQPYHHHQQLSGSGMDVDEDTEMTLNLDGAQSKRKEHESSLFITPISQSRRMAATATSRVVQSPEGGSYMGKAMSDEDEDYRLIQSSVLIGTPSTVKAGPGRSVRPGDNPGSSAGATSSPNIFFSKESLYLGSRSMGGKEKNQILGI